MGSIINKDEVHRLVDRLPANTTWEELMHQIYVMEAIEQGLDDSRNDKVTPVNEIRRHYGLPE